MKKIASVLCLCVMCAALCLPLASCSSEGNAHDGFQIMSVDINDFIIEAPDEWEITSQNGFVSAKAPGYDGDLSSISATSFQVLEEVQTPEQYFEHAVTKPFGDGHALEVYEQDAELKLDGRDAKRYVYSLDMYGEEYKYMMIVCVYGGRVYVITYTSTPEFYDSHTAYMTDILNLFKFKV